MAHQVNPVSESVPSREMLRANTTVALVIVAVLVLAFVAVLAGLRAARSQARAEAAEAAGRERLWNGNLSEARAIRISGEAGRREKALGIISNAATFRASSALRTEAVATLALSDLTREGAMLSAPKDPAGRDLDAALRHYAYGDLHGNVMVGDFANRKSLFTLQARELGQGTRMAVANVFFSPDGSLLAARFAGGAVVVWDLETKLVLMSVNAESTKAMASDLAFSPDSKQIIFTDVEAQGEIAIFEAATGRKLSSGIQTGLKYFQLRPDGKQVAIVAEGGVALLDYPSGTKLQTLPHFAPVSMMSWSPDGNQLATSCDDGDVFIWDLPRGKHRVLHGHSERCVSLGFSRDGKSFFSSSRDGTTRLWDLVQGQTIATGEGLGCRFTPDSTRLGFWSPAAGFGAWRFFQSPDFRLLSCPKSEGQLFTLDLSPSGQWCVATQNKGFRIWDLSAGDRETYVALPGFYCARFSADEQSLIVCRSTGLEIWPLTCGADGGLTLQASQAKKLQLPDALGARAVALSLDGHMAAVELTDRRMVVIDLGGERAPVELKARWRDLNFKGPASPTGAGRFAISPDGRWVVTGFDFGVDDVPRIWDARSGELAMTLNAESSVVAFSPDGRWLGLVGMDHYSIWSVGDWRRLGEFERDEASITHGTLAFTREEGCLALANTRQSVQLRPALAGERFFDLIGPTRQSVNSLRLALDGSVLVTATASDLVQVWRLKHLKSELGGLNLDWTGPSRHDIANTAQTGIGVSGLHATLAFSFAGVMVAGVFAVLTLRQHRRSIARFVSAEAVTAQQNRQLEMAKIELMHSQKMQALGTLSAGIAHDFNNLLSVIRMSNKLIGRSLKGNAEIEEYVADIEQAAVQGKNVVRSMLGYARDESSPTAPTNVNEVVESSVSLLNKEFLGGIQLTLELSSETQPVVIHQGRLEQILLNLIVNASEAMQGEGRLKISVQLRSHVFEGPMVLRPRDASQSQYVELTVSDSGPGIPPEIIGRIFEPFFSTKRAGATVGTGLGLSLVYSIARQDGLGLSVANIPGAGAMFSMLIPVAETKGDSQTVREMHSFEQQAKG